MNDYRIEISSHGGPEVLIAADFSPKAPSSGEILVSNHAIGLNYADVYFRTGQKGPHGAVHFPAVPGGNGAGIVEAVGDDVSDFKPGDRVAYVSPGAYATKVIVPVGNAMPLPSFMTFEACAASLLRGMTAEYLLHRLFKVERGMDVLVHAAAGGMGQILCQWLRAKEANAIGTAGSPEKVEIARRLGCNVVINYREADFVAETLAATDGKGVHVAYDAVGKDVFLQTLGCMRPMGVVASYGAASGPAPLLDIQKLHHNSLFVTRPRLRSYIATPEMLRRSADCFFRAVEIGAIRLGVDKIYALKDAPAAHDDLEARRTAGACIFKP